MRNLPRAARAALLLAGPALAALAPRAALAQMPAHSGLPMEAEEPIFMHGMLDELEGRFGPGQESFRWGGEAWVGTDTNRLWLKSEGFANAGRVQQGQHELLYARPISPWFDLQAGVRYDLDSSAGRGWAALGLEGLAPYFLQLSATLYASDEGHLAARLLIRHETLLTQRLILEPLVELNAYSRSDPGRDTGAGLSDLDCGLRLRYEIRRKFAPYLGAAYQRVRGSGAVGSGSEPQGANGWRFALGVRAWF